MVVVVVAAVYQEEGDVNGKVLKKMVKVVVGAAAAVYKEEGDVDGKLLKKVVKVAAAAAAAVCRIRRRGTSTANC